MEISSSLVESYRIIYKSGKRTKGMTMATDEDIRSGEVRIYRIVGKQTRGRGE